MLLQSSDHWSITTHEAYISRLPDIQLVWLAWEIYSARFSYEDLNVYMHMLQICQSSGHYRQLNIHYLSDCVDGFSLHVLEYWQLFIDDTQVIECTEGWTSELWLLSATICNALRSDNQIVQIPLCIICTETSFYLLHRSFVLFPQKIILFVQKLRFYGT